MRLLGSSGSRYAALVAATVAVPLLAAPGAATAAPTAVDEKFTSPGHHKFMVPDGVERIRVTALGAGGGGGGGGGNNDGSLSGGGGGGGGAGAAVSCTLSVESGETLYVSVGEGGAGGAGGAGKYSNGKPGTEGTDTGVVRYPHHLVIAAQGRPGKGGEGSGTFESGSGGSGGAGGAATDSWCGGPGPEPTAGGAGDHGGNASKNAPGMGGREGKAILERSCGYLVGYGGDGGRGAGNSGGDYPHQVPSGGGKKGNNGCVVLTY